MMRNVRLSVTGIIPAVIASGLSLYSQVVSGTIVGTVHDPSGAAVSGTGVTLRNLDTNQTRESNTNDVGAFTFATLPPGHYKVSTSHPGFKSAVTSDIDLQIDQTARVDLTLEVGQVSEEVTVSAASAVLETDTATMGQVIAEKPVNDLPLNGRNFLDLASLTAGVVPATAATNQTARIGRSELTTHVAGGRGYANSFLIDGIESRGARLGEISFLPSPDTIKEFKIQENYYSAEYGTNPGIISVSIKSGSNIFHGTAYEFLRNSDLDKPQYFDQGHVAPFKQNQFGANLGGPVLRNRAFFFLAYDGQRVRQSTQAFAVVPNPQYLTGNFAGLVDAGGKPIVLKNPLNGNAPFQDNLISMSQQSKIARNFNQYIQAPNTNMAQGNYTGNPETFNDFNQYHIKIDHRFSDSDSMFGRYSRSSWNILNQGLLPFSGSSFPLNSQSGVIQETHIFGPTAVNTLKLGVNRDVVANSNEVAGQNLASQLGIQNLTIAPYDFSLPRFTISGFTQMGHSQQTFHQWTNAYILSDTFALVRGSHNISLGGDVRAYRSPTSTTNASNGRITVGSTFTGYSLADYLLGAYQTASAGTSYSTGDFRNSQYALFVQDDYKILPRLTLNLGLRWEYNTPWRELGGSEGFFDQTAGVLRLANPPSIYGVNFPALPGVVVGGVAPGVYPGDHKQFAPRIGLAYKLNDKTVIRSGYGIFYLTNQGSHTIEISTNPGSAVTVSSTNSAGQVPRLLDTLFDTPAQALLSAGNTPSTVDADRHPSYMQQWNLNIQRELPGNLLLEVGYIGSKGTHLVGTQDLNAARLNLTGQNLSIQGRRPYPLFNSVKEWFSEEDSSYNALLATAQRRLTKGLSVMASYTYSKSIDDGSASANDANLHQIPNNFRLDRGLSAFDVRNRLAFNGILELPFGANRRFFSNAHGAAGWVVGGWQANTIVQFQSGLPFSVTEVTDQSQTGVGATERPNRIANGNLPVSQRNPNQWFNTGAFMLNQLGTYGNAGRDVLFQNGVKNVDLSLFKNNFFDEKRFNLQFRAELFNLLNDTNFAAPAAAIDGPKFGVVSATGPARQIQFALKFLF
jgi:hypothetical protein